MNFPQPERFIASRTAFEQARAVIPSGVNSTARSIFAGWEPYPLFVRDAAGSHLTDIDGNTYVDYLLGLGPMLFGHRPEVITRAVVEHIERRGTMFALPIEEEAALARKVLAAMPAADQVHLTATGTEAVLYAVRLARAYTRRHLIVRFEGMYHGFSDAVYWSKHPPLEAAGPDDTPRPVAQGPGIPVGVEDSLIILQWNDEAALRHTFERQGEQIAAVITEPVMCNTGCILPAPGYLEAMREVTSQTGALLIYDEVITGFRVALGGAQSVYGISPDLTVLAKGMGGGFPVAAVCGRKEVMALVASGAVSMAGTYAANGIAVAAANASLDILAQPGAFEPLLARSHALRGGLQNVFDEAHVAARVVGLGPLFQVWFSRQPIRDYRDAARYANQQAFRVWWEEMLVRGVLFHPGPFENLFVSFAHTEEDVDWTLRAAAKATQALRTRI
jgi:glutamate-1-semialdehyde 2,1-aminomutase